MLAIISAAALTGAAILYFTMPDSPNVDRDMPRLILAGLLALGGGVGLLVAGTVAVLP